VSPDKQLLAVVGDDPDALLVDPRNGKVFVLFCFVLFCFLLIISAFLVF
jgi:hypothetical protein